MRHEREFATAPFAVIDTREHPDRSRELLSAYGAEVYVREVNAGSGHSRDEASRCRYAPGAR